MSEVSAMDDEVHEEIYAEKRDEDLVPQGLVSNKAEHQTPGEMLREARIACGYSVAELCGQTKLPRQTVEALEDNQFDKLSQPVFARGYYRKCAGVLGIDVDAIMAAYAASGGARAAARPIPLMGVNVVPTDVTPARRRTFGTFFLVLILLIAAFAAYLFWTERGDEPIVGADGGTKISLSTEFTAPVSSVGGTAGTNVGMPGDNAAPAGPAAAPGAASSTSASSGSVGGDTSPPGDAQAGNETAPVVAAEQTQTEKPAVAQTGNKDAAPQTSPVSQASPSSAAAASTALTLAFDSRSWVNVHDATGKQLLVGIYDSTRQTLNGVPPYKVVIGYAPGVKVRFQGEPVQFNVADDNTARFTVGSGKH